MTINEDEETWKVINNYPNYKISSYGQVKHIKKNKLCNIHLCDGNSYVYVETRTVLHKLVADVFIENPNKYKYVYHLDGNKLNNHYLNLKWVKLPIKHEDYIKIDNEIWLILKENENYEITIKGDVRNKHNKTLLTSIIGNHGYKCISLSSKINKTETYPLHILLANNFISKIEGKDSVDHIDRNKLNNNISNLRWSDSIEQNNNRNYTKNRKSTTAHRKIWKINPKDKSDKVLYNNIDEAIDFIIENKLCKTINRYKIHDYINLQLYAKYRNKLKMHLVYGFKWEFVPVEDLPDEIWLSIRDKYSNAFNYLISNMGRIKCDRGHIINGTEDKAGYNTISIDITNKYHRIHRLVCEFFLPQDNIRPLVNHKNGNKLDNRLCNLEYCTHSENVQHAMDTGLNPCCKPIKTINIITKEEITYTSKNDLIRKLHFSKNTITKYMKDNKPYKNLLFQYI